jgi:hypothetical protein
MQHSMAVGVGSFQRHYLLSQASKSSAAFVVSTFFSFSMPSFLCLHYLKEALYIASCCMTHATSCCIFAPSSSRGSVVCFYALGYALSLWTMLLLSLTLNHCLHNLLSLSFGSAVCSYALGYASSLWPRCCFLSLTLNH